MNSIPPMRRGSILAALLALAAVAAPSATPQTSGQQGDEYLVTTSKEGDPLASFVAIVAGVTREPYFVDPDEVRGVRIRLEGTKRVPRAKFMAFVDQCIQSVGFVHVETQVAGVRAHRLVKGNDGNGTRSVLPRLKTMAQVLDPSELPRFADRQTLITTTFTCKNLPAWTTVTTLQLLFADVATEAIRTIEGTDFLVMTGPAAHVADVVRMCERLERETTATRDRATDDLEKRIAALEAKVAELTPKAK